MKIAKSLPDSFGLLCSLFFCASSIFSLHAVERVCAQEFTSGTLIPSMMEKVRAQQEYVDMGLCILDDKDYRVLEPYFKDPDVFVRRQAMLLADTCADYSTSLTVQQKYIETRFLYAFDQKTYGPSVATLQRFRPEHFSAKARVMLGEHLVRALEEYKASKTDDNRNRLNSLILCAASARATEYLDLLKKAKTEFRDVFEDLKSKYKPIEKYMQKIENPWFDQPAWTAVRARALMEEKEDMEFCIHLVDSFPDPEMKGRVLFEELRQIERPEVMAYFYKSLSNEEKSYNDAGKWRTLSEIAAEQLLYMIDDKALSKINWKTPDLVQRIRTYVEEKAGGNPQKLPIKDTRKECFESLRKNREILKQQKRQTQQAGTAPVETKPTPIGEKQEKEKPRRWYPK